MRGLIGDLLDVGRIDSGTLSVSPEPAEVAGLVDRARNTFLSGGGRHSVLIDLPPDLPPALADRRRIVQVLNNLFSNASRHAPESSPIRVTAVREGVHVAISVADEGRGVAPERLPHLIRKHTGLAGGDREGALGAAGLGLAICKGLVEAHGGRIRAASGGAGQGTEITFTLPVAGAAGEGAAAGLVPGGPPVPRDGPERTPILVVDDDPKTLRYVRDALAGSEYAPLVTGDPKAVSDLKQLPILVIDEAQHLRNDVLEDLRLLCNFAMDSENRLCLLLVGLTELRRRLAMAVHESLSQRLIVRHHLNGLDRDELDHYLTHRLRLAGCELPLFEPCAVEALFQSTRGLPRLINRIAHYALTAAAPVRRQRARSRTRLHHDHRDRRDHRGAGARVRSLALPRLSGNGGTM